MGKKVTSEVSAQSITDQTISWLEEDKTYYEYLKYTQRRTQDGLTWEEKNFEITMTMDDPYKMSTRVMNSLTSFLKSVDFDMFSEKAIKMEKR